MALKIPNTLSNLIFSDSQSASLVQQSLTSSVQPLLNFINQYFQTSGSGGSVLLTLQQPLTLIKQLLIASGSMQTPGLAFKDNNTLGVFYDQANQRMGLVINNTLVGFVSAAGMNLQAPSAAGNAATFYNAAGVGIASVNNAGTITSLAGGSNSSVPGFVSQAGFRQTIPMGTLTNVTLNANTGGTTQLVSANGQALQCVMSYSGSVVGLALNSASSAPVQIFLAKNGTIIFNGTNTVSNTSFAANSQPMNKNAYQFAANDYLGLSVRSNNTTAPANVYVQGYMTIEMGA